MNCMETVYDRDKDDAEHAPQLRWSLCHLYPLRSVTVQQ